MCKAVPPAGQRRLHFKGAPFKCVFNTIRHKMSHPSGLGVAPASATMTLNGQGMGMMSLGARTGRMWPLQPEPLVLWAGPSPVLQDKSFLLFYDHKGNICSEEKSQNAGKQKIKMQLAF